jgi:hypothetical protein
MTLTLNAYYSCVLLKDRPATRRYSRIERPARAVGALALPFPAAVRRLP